MEDKFNQWKAQVDGKPIEAEDPTNLYQLFDNLYQLQDNVIMKIYPIDSKTHGQFKVLVDDEDFEMMNLLGGKWNVSILRGKPYIQKRLHGGKLIQLHRFIVNAPKGTYVDHINRNTLDNQRKNLRITTNSANIRNAGVRPNNSSGYTGIYKKKNQPLKPYRAQIRVKYKIIGLGSFKTFEEAYKARKEAEKKYFNI